MRNVIIDCDPGIDDSLAIMLALKSPELNILGITVVSGNVSVNEGVENAKKILDFMGRLFSPTSPHQKPLCPPNPIHDYFKPIHVKISPISF